MNKLRLGSGEVAKLIRNHNWEQSPLGPPESWPASLRTVVNLISNSKFPMFIAWGPELGFIYNDAYSEILGQKHPSALGMRFHDIWSEIWDEISPIIDKAMAGESSYYENLPLTLMRKGFPESTWFTFSYSPLYNESGEVSGMYCACTETSQQIIATQALKESEERLRQLANTIPQLAWIAQPDGTIYWFNDRYFEYTGTTLEQVQGRGWQRVHEPEDWTKTEEKYRTLFANGTLFELTEPLLSANGEYRTFYTKAAPLHDSAGNIVQWFGSHTDIHEIEKAQQELRDSNRRKDEFLAMLAHELRNPLAPIRTAAEILALAELDPERTRYSSSIISRQVAHMTELVDDLLDVSRVTRGLIELQRLPVPINEVIKDALEQVKHFTEIKQQQLSIDIPQQPLFVSGDRTRLVQIVSNILNNASRYTPEHGQICIQLTAHPDQVEITISDNGMGIPGPLIPHIFELFTQAERSPDRSQGGLGLGLALVKSLVELHQGTVSAFSEGKDLGSRFTISLPRLLEPATEAANNNPASQVIENKHQANLRVLIVDDNVDAAQTLGLLLETRGYSVVTRHSAAEGLQAVIPLQPHIIILDIGLPDFDGYELAQQIRKLPGFECQLLIALTGYGQRQDRQQSKAAGFDLHFVKPVDLKELFDALSNTTAN